MTRETVTIEMDGAARSMRIELEIARRGEVHDRLRVLCPVGRKGPLVIGARVSDLGIWEYQMAPSAWALDLIRRAVASESTIRALEREIAELARRLEAAHGGRPPATVPTELAAVAGREPPAMERSTERGTQRGTAPSTEQGPANDG